MQDDNDIEARFRALLRDNLGRLKTIARSYAAVGEDEDLLQDMLMQIWHSLPRFDHRARVSTWVYRIALNTAMGCLRKRYTRPVMRTMSHEQLQPWIPGSVGDPSDPDALLEHFLQRLPPVDRALLMLTLDDLSYAEIAEVTGLNTNAVGIRLTRIKQRFKQDYVDNYPEQDA